MLNTVHGYVPWDDLHLIFLSTTGARRTGRRARCCWWARAHGISFRRRTVEHTLRRPSASRSAVIESTAAECQRHIAYRGDSARPVSDQEDDIVPSAACDRARASAVTTKANASVRLRECARSSCLGDLVGDCRRRIVARMSRASSTRERAPAARPEAAHVLRHDATDYRARSSDIARGATTWLPDSPSAGARRHSGLATKIRLEQQFGRAAASMLPTSRRPTLRRAGDTVARTRGSRPASERVMALLRDDEASATGGVLLAEECCRACVPFPAARG